MAAPSGTVWGSIVGSYGRVGIHVALTHTNTHTTRVVTLWFWSKYSISDSTNTLYYDAGTTSATSSKGSVSISTSVSSGSGWSTSNQVKLKTYSHTYARGTSNWSESCAMKLTGIDRVGGTMTATTSYTVPKLASYTVAYNANGGSGAPSSQTKYYGKNLTLSSTVPTKSGYTFLGWGTSSSTTSVSYAKGATYSANAGITLYAIWRKTITITYSVGTNGGSLGSIPTSQTAYAYNSATSVNITLSNNTGPSKSGYTFLGWSTNSGATSASYTKGTAYTFSSSVTLHPIWRKTITITYNANGGSYTGSTSVGYIYNANTKTNITITSTKPTKSGYTFLGWGTSTTSTSVAYYSGSPYDFSANTTVYAIWKKTITITYDANGGLNPPTATNTDIYNSTTSANITLSTTTPTRTDYNFLGWSLYSDATTATYSSGAIATFTESKTLYAVWEVAYIKPTIYNVKVDRVDIDGNSADDGTFVAISVEVKATEQLQSVDFSYTINNITHTERPMIVVQAITDTSPVQNIIGWYTSVNKFILGRTLATEENQDIFSVEHDYTITITATDEVGNSTYDVVVDSINVQIDIGQDSVAIGKIAEGYKYFEVDYDSGFNKAVAIGGTVIENNFTSYLPVEFNENLTFATPKMIYGYNYSTGEKIECFCPQSAAGTTSMGYGGYVAKTGQTKVFGNLIEILSNTNVKITSGDLQVFNAQNWLGRWCLTTDYIALYSAVVDGTTRKGWIGWGGTNDLYLTNETGGYVRLGNNTSRHIISAGHHYFANGTTYYISNGGGFNLASGTVNGNLTITGHTYNKGHVYFCGTTYYCSNAGHVYCNTAHVRSGSLQIGTAGIDNSHALLMTQFNLGTTTASDGNRYYINNNATGRFNALRYTSSKAISSRRFKNNIDYKDNDYWHDALMQIKPCTFFYKNDGKTKHIGLIAEDLYDLIPELVGLDDEEDSGNDVSNVKPLPSAIEYANLTVPIIGELQLLNKIVEEQDEIIKSQNERISNLESEISELKSLIQQLLNK